MAKTPKSKQVSVSVPSALLQKWNLWLAALHGVQGLLILLLSSTHILPIYVGYQTPDQVSSEITGHAVTGVASRQLFDVNLAYVVAILLFIGTAAHLLMATAGRQRYEAGLKKGINGMRWIQYGLSFSLILTVVALLAGVIDVLTLSMIFVLNAAVHLLGWLFETRRKANDASAPLVAVGAVAGLTPWLAVAFSMWATTVFGSGSVPGFVYGLYGTMLAALVGCAVMTYLQLKRSGRWGDYILTERMYMIINLAAITLFVWQVFAGAL